MSVRFVPNATGDLTAANALVALFAEIRRRQTGGGDYIVRYDAEYRGAQFTDRSSQIIADLTLWGIEPTLVYSTDSMAAQREAFRFIAHLREQGLIEQIPYNHSQPHVTFRRMLSDGASVEAICKAAKGLWNIDAEFVHANLPVMRLAVESGIVEDYVTSRAFLTPPQPFPAFARSPGQLTSYGAGPLTFCLREVVELGVRHIVRHQCFELVSHSVTEAEFYRRLGLDVEFTFLPRLCAADGRPLTKSRCAEFGQERYKAREWFWRHRDDPAMPQEHVANVARTHLLNLVLKEPWPILTLDEMAARFEWDMLTDQNEVVVTE